MTTVDDVHEILLLAEDEIKYAELAIDSLSSQEDAECVAEYQPRGTVIPAINELRYAARHLIAAMKSPVDSSAYLEQLQRAARHGIRARFDALRATALFLIRHFQRFSQEYRLALVLSDDERRDLNEHREKVVKLLDGLSRAHRWNTDEECGYLKTQICELQQFYLRVEKERSRYDQLLASMASHDHATAKQWWWSLIWAAIIAVVFFVLGIAFSCR